MFVEEGALSAMSTDDAVARLRALACAEVGATVSEGILREWYGWSATPRASWEGRTSGLATFATAPLILCEFGRGALMGSIEDIDDGNLNTCTDVIFY